MESFKKNILRKSEVMESTLEMPFFRDGMTFQEYEEERHEWHQWMMGKRGPMEDYEPMWKRKSD